MPSPILINAVPSASADGTVSDDTSAPGVLAVKRRRNLDGFVDYPLTEAQQARANVKLFRFIVHANIAFAAAENWYFCDFLDELRPSYLAPSRYVLSHTIMDGEAARVQIEEVDWIKQRKRLMLLIDGWEDKLKRSLYGIVASEVNQYPVVLSLQDLTGHRGSAEKLIEISQKAMDAMELGDGQNFIALTMDNPTVMQSFRNRFHFKFTWILTFACFLHGLNTIIGEITSYPAMKKIVSKTTRIVTFFNSSHYWGGQLNVEVKKENITRKMKQNCESRWYALQCTPCAWDTALGPFIVDTIKMILKF